MFFFPLRFIVNDICFVDFFHVGSHSHSHTHTNEQCCVFAHFECLYSSFCDEHSPVCMRGVFICLLFVVSHFFTFFYYYFSLGKQFPRTIQFFFFFIYSSCIGVPGFLDRYFPCQVLDFRNTMDVSV